MGTPDDRSSDEIIYDAMMTDCRKQLLAGADALNFRQMAQAAADALIRAKGSWGERVD